MKVTMYTDGAARGNPDGPGGYGTVLSCVVGGEEHIREYSGGYVRTTNNRMELMAAIAALRGVPIEIKGFEGLAAHVQKAGK